MDFGSLLRLSHLFKLNHCANTVDFVDQLNYQYTGGLLFFLIGVISARQYFGKPIQCWVPVHYSRAWTEYAENVCWTQNTYFLPSDKNIPQNIQDVKKQQHVTYYQWITIFLGLQAVISYLPYLLWYLSSRRFSHLLATLKKSYILDKEASKKSIALLSGGIEEQIEKNERKYSLLDNSSINGGTCAFFFCSRMICIAMCCFQIYSMKLFLDMDSIFFGANVLKNVIQGYQWKSSGHFPRVTICRFEIRNWKPSTVEVETIQCALTINYFFEKMYVFLWFWFVIMTFVTIINTLMWSVRIGFAYSSHSFIKRYIKRLRNQSKTDDKKCRKFLRSFLGLDCVFLLLSVSNSVSDLVVLEVINKSWNLFLQLCEIKNMSENVQHNETDIDFDIV